MNISPAKLDALRECPEFSIAWCATDEQKITVNKVRELLIQAAQDERMLKWLTENKTSLPVWADRFLWGVERPFGNLSHSTVPGGLSVAVYGYTDAISQFTKEIQALLAWVDILTTDAKKLTAEAESVRFAWVRISKVNGMLRLANSQHLVANGILPIVQDALTVIEGLRIQVPASALAR